MKFTAYILKDKTGKLYKGSTNNLRRRLIEHRNGKTITTSKMKDIFVAYTEEFGSIESARKRELYFKSAAGRRFLKSKLGL
jgi:putative endonuclease